MEFTVPKQTVDCSGPGPDCAVKTTVTGSVPVSGASTSARQKTVKLGGSSSEVKAGTRDKVKVKLTRVGFNLLKRPKIIRAKVTITVMRGGTSAKKTLKVTLQAPKSKRS